ncbi:hypothetical protein DFH06DRAFT_1327487 [Mycena polygramma]|nr:hypothetical protein DFH06DRAFT_1327487 [Mycena polygramma]
MHRAPHRRPLLCDARRPITLVNPPSSLAPTRCKPRLDSLPAPLMWLACLIPALIPSLFSFLTPSVFTFATHVPTPTLSGCNTHTRRILKYLETVRDGEDAEMETRQGPGGAPHRYASRRARMGRLVPRPVPIRPHTPPIDDFDFDAQVTDADTDADLGAGKDDAHDGIAHEKRVAATVCGLGSGTVRRRAGWCGAGVFGHLAADGTNLSLRCSPPN